MKYIAFLFTILFSMTSFAASFTTLTVKQKSEHPRTVVIISYPQIKTAAHPAEIQFNTLARTHAFAMLQRFNQRAVESSNASLPADLKAGASTMKVTYDLNTARPNGYVSVRYLTDTSHPGDAHPAHKYTALNYDLSTGKELKLTDLLQPNTLSEIAKMATLSLTGNLKKVAPDGSVTLFQEGLTPTLENYQVWNLTPQGLRLTFNEYQVVAYVYGPQEVTLPYSSLQKYILNDSPLKNAHP